MYIDSLAERQHPEALYVKALQALQKVKKESDHKIAIELFKKAADRGSADAGLQIGLLFQKANRPADALPYIEKAHEKGVHHSYNSSVS